MSFSKCMDIVNDMDQDDQDSVLSKLDQYTSMGMSPEQAQKAAVTDVLEELKVERAEFIRLVEEQHPETKVESDSTKLKKDSTKDVTKTPAFKRWSKGLDVINAGEEYVGGPAVFVAYHGTTHGDITKFNRVGVSEGFLGKGPYFTTDPEDASENYAGVGPDLTNRIQAEKERYEDADSDQQVELLQDYFDANPGELPFYVKANKPDFDIESWDSDGDAIEELFNRFAEPATDLAATKAIKGDTDGLMMKVYVKLENPADTTGNSQPLTYEYTESEDGDIESETGTLLDWIEAARSWGENNSVSGMDDYIGSLQTGDEVSMKDAFDLARKHLNEAYEENGEMISAGGIFAEIAEEAGYDGVIMDAGLHFGNRSMGGIRTNGMKGVKTNTLHMVPFEATQVKSATGNKGGFDPKDKDITHSIRDLGFYSELATQISNASMKQAPASEWKSFIKAAKGVKADEIEWSGVNDYLDLQTGKVTKNALIDYLNSEGVQVEETVLGGTPNVMEYDVYKRTGNRRVLMETFRTEEEALDYMDEAEADDGGKYEVQENANPEKYTTTGDTKYEGYKLDGGTNYREVLLMLPTTKPSILEAMSTEELAALITSNDDNADVDGLVRNDLLSMIKSMELNGASLKKLSGKTSDVYTSQHWDQKNVIAHLRVDDRTDVDGDKTMFVQELQSDSGQAKRDGKTDWDAPFIGSTSGWLNLALKRAIIMAAQGGYKKVAFINGEQSADRYSLDKKLSKVSYRVSGDDNYKVQAFDMRSYKIDMPPTLDAENLEEYIGKEIAKKIVDTATKDDQSLEGDGLKIEAKGMREFYDKLVPNALKGLLKKLGGGQLTSVNLTTNEDGWNITEPSRNIHNKWMLKSSDYNSKGELFETEDDAKNALSEKLNKLTQLGFEITPQMIKKVEAGVPLFSKREQKPNIKERIEKIKQASKGRASNNAEYDNYDTDAGRQLVLDGPESISDKAPVSFIEGREQLAGTIRFDGSRDRRDGRIGIADDLDKRSARGDNLYESAKIPGDGNDGRADDSVSNSIRNGTSAWDAPVNTGFDDLVYKLQDKLIDTKRVIKAITDSVGQIAEDFNVYLQEELFHGRAAKRVSDFEADELKPLMEHMARDGYEMADVEKYLQARHAKEANALIASRDITMPDGGSGMFDVEVDDYFNNLSAADATKLADIALKVDAITAKTRQMYADYGLESQDTVDSWGQMFQHYVPLFREDKKPNGQGTGQGFSIKSKEVKSRTGSTQKVVDILAHIAMQRERLIVRGEKNRVSTALVGLAQSNPNPDFWKVGPPPGERVYDPKTKRVIKRTDPMYKSRDNVLVAKIKQADGSIKEVAVNFNERDDRALRMASALKNLDAGKLEGLLGVSAKITRYFSAINTSLSPVFGVVNLVRDVQSALINLNATPLAGKKGRIAKDTAMALAGIYSDLRAVRQGRHPGSAWASLFEEFQNEGGQTGYRQMFATSKDRADGLQKVLTPYGWMDSKWGNYFTANGMLKVPLEKLQDGASLIFNWLSDYNESMENAVRLATYKAGIDQGMSKQASASLAKNLTVNFNRKGEKALQAGALYAFFNAAMQGSARIGETLFDMDQGNIKTARLSKVGKKIVYGGMLLGSMQALALAAAGFGDDDPPEFVRERSLIIPTGGKTYINIPMPLGFHVIPGLGRHLTEFAINGFEKPARRTVSIIGMFADAFNPIGNAGLSIQTLAPTALDPLVAIRENKDWSGRPIARVSSNPALPGHKQFKDSATWVEKGIAEAINGITGGNDYVAGALSPTPDQIGYLIGQVTGGVGREMNKVAQTVGNAATGEELPLYKIPLVGRFVGNAASQASQANAFYSNVNKLNELETEIKGMRKDGKGQDAMVIVREHPEARFINMANVTERQIQKMRKQKRELIEKDVPKERIVKIEEQITQAMTRFNKAMDSVQKK